MVDNTQVFSFSFTSYVVDISCSDSEFELGITGSKLTLTIFVYFILLLLTKKKCITIVTVQTTIHNYHSIQIIHCTVI